MKPNIKPLFLAMMVVILVVLGGCNLRKTPGSNGGNGTGSGPFTIGGTVMGLASGSTGLVLMDNGTETLTISGNGPFTFKTTIPSGMPFNVSIASPPFSPAQSCTVVNGSGTASANVTTVQVNCSTGTGNVIGGQVTGLLGTGLVLQDNGKDNLPVSANGGFTFATTISSGASYSVTIFQQPSNPAQTCTITNSAGIASSNVSNVVVTCSGGSLTLGGSVSGLLGSGMVLQNNGANSYPVSGTGNFTFTFPGLVTVNSAYAVTVSAQPSNPTQLCSAVNGTGTITGNVSNVQIICTQPGFTIGGSVVGLVTGPGDTLELQDNAGDDLFVTGDTTFTFPTPVTNGGIYNVSMFLPPTSQPQPCNLFQYTGIAHGNVGDVIVDCQHNDWNWVSWYIPTTNGANNYSSVTTSLFPVNPPPPPDRGTPGGRDFAASWTDAVGRRWLFGGFGFPYPSPLGKQPPGLLNDLWVFDGSWLPANLCTYSDIVGDRLDDISPLQFTNVSGVYSASGSTCSNNATIPSAPPSPAPGSRWGSSNWTDAGGNLWMFGGQGYDDTNLDFTLLNDLWEFVPGAPTPNEISAGTVPGNWTWKGGSHIGNQKGTYGTMGAASPLNTPGGRWAAATFKDSLGNVWLFGGQGLDSAGTTGLLNDLWKYNTVSGQWTWVAGPSPSLANTNGAYGAPGAAGNAPGGRQAAILWVDASNNVWLFGGFGFDSAGTGIPAGAILNDLWKYDIATGQWTWVSGNKLANQTGVYGTQTVAAAANFPGARWGAVAWTDASSNLWLFGGWGYGSVITDPTGFLNDIWEYQHSTGQWIWWKGTSNVNQNGQYLTNGIPFVNNVVGGRRGAAIWQPDSQDPFYVWVFGGEGDDGSQGTSPGYLNDMWTYLPFP